MYVSWKDDKKTQTIQPKTWTLLTFNGQSQIVPDKDAKAHWGTYLNVKDNGGSKRIKVRFSRDPKKTNDFTGQTCFNLEMDSYFSHTWFFQARKGIPVGVMVYHDGPKPLVLATREFKASIG